MSRRHIPAVGISFTLAGFFILSLFSALNKYVQQDMGFSTAQVMFFDGLVGALCMVAMSWQQKNLKGLKPGHILQAPLVVINVVAGYMFFQSYPHVPLVTAYLIAFTGPMLITLFSALFLKERITWRQGAAVVVGFLAVAYGLLTSNPVEGHLFDPEQLPWILRLACGTLMFSVAQVMVRKLSDTESVWSFPFFFYIGLFLVSGVFFSAELVMPQTGREWVMMAMLGILDAASLAMMYLALKYAKASTVVPFQYSGMIWVAMLDLILWNKLPATGQVIGAVVLVLAGVFLATESGRRRRRAKKRAEKRRNSRA